MKKLQYINTYVYYFMSVISLGNLAIIIYQLNINQHKVKKQHTSMITTNNESSGKKIMKIPTQQSAGKPVTVDYNFSDSSHLQNHYRLQPRLKDEFMMSFKTFTNSADLLSSEDNRSINERLLQLEGECKIKEWEFIRINIIQSILGIIFLVITFFGLFALKYSASFRKKIFFQKVQPNQATHIYITNNDKNNDIVKILKPGSNPILFLYKQLKYSISSAFKGKPIPVGYEFEKQFDDCFRPQRLKKGLTPQEVLSKRQAFGPNEHLVQMPNYFQYLIDVMTQPFFLLQYFFCFIFFLENYAAFAIALLSFSFFTTTINYILLYVSYRKIKKIAQKIIQVQCVRDGSIIKIQSKQLVPGDVYIPEQQAQIPADCIVGFGDVYVNEANLTGESFPIGKFQISQLKDIDNSSVWLYEGSKILQTKVGNTYAVVINTGFATHRGRIIRKILNRTVKDPDILRTTLIFVIQVILVSLITFFATLYLQINKDTQKVFIFFKFIDFLASAAPPPLPIFFNLAYSFSLFRLGICGIIGTQPQKTVDGAQVKTFCFDKTGTLTQSNVNIVKIFKLSKENNINFHNIINQLGHNENSLIWQLFSTCHTTKLINNQLLGDQIDKQMFKFINAKMELSIDPNIRFVVKSTKQFAKKSQQQSLQIGKQKQDLFQLQKKRQSLIQMKNKFHLQVLRINQFQSRFQSMSVLIKDVINNKYYIFVKGSPEKILSNSKNIAPNSQNYQIYTRMIKTLSLNGFRTIGMGFKEVNQVKQLQMYLKADRDKYLENVTNLGLIAFENSLKLDTWLTLNRLKRSNIETKMITGDNIYIAVETARRAGIIQQEEKVVILQGRRNKALFNVRCINLSDNDNQGTGFSRTFQGTVISKLKNDVSQDNQQSFVEEVVKLHQKSDYLKGKFTFAVDDQFLTLNPPPLLSHNIKVFARIPPQNKAYIIKQYKRQHNQYCRTHHSKLTNWLKTKTWKIGMCGDGANDLLALREADLSIGIQATDASYGSSFTVSNMLDVDWVIKQSRCTQANIIQLYQFYGSISFFVLIASIILVTDVTYFSTSQLMYLNFGTILLIPGTLGMSRPYGQETEYVPDANMLGVHNHLIFWGNIIIPYLGLLGTWFYYSNTSEYMPNSKPRAYIAEGGFNSKNYSTTLVFLMVILTAVCNGFIIYRSRPWRQRFFRNYLFTLLITCNLAIAFSFAFLTEPLEKAMDFMPISSGHMGVCIGIMISSLLANFLYNLLIDRFELDHKKIILQKQQAQLASMIVRKNRMKTVQNFNPI